MRQLKISKQITGRDSYSMEKYLKEVSKLPMLKPEEEVFLARLSRGGDKVAKEKLILGNLRFVISVAKQYQSSGLSLEDLINEGNVGLMKSVTCYDETKGFKFISYAVWWIRQSILQAIADYARMIRLPLNKISAINKISRAAMSLEQKLQREPTAEELSEVMNLSTSEIERSIASSKKPVSLDTPVTSDDDATTLQDLYMSEQNSPLDNFDASLFYDSLKEDIKRLLSVLPKRQTAIVRMYYGLDDGIPKSLDEIGSYLELTSERVRQLKSKAIKKLKEIKNNDRYKTYM